MREGWRGITLTNLILVCFGVPLSPAPRASCVQGADQSLNWAGSHLSGQVLEDGCGVDGGGGTHTAVGGGAALEQAVDTAHGELKAGTGGTADGLLLVRAGGTLHPQEGRARPTAAPVSVSGTLEQSPPGALLLLLSPPQIQTCQTHLHADGALGTLQ